MHHVEISFVRGRDGEESIYSAGGDGGLFSITPVRLNAWFCGQTTWI